MSLSKIDLCIRVIDMTIYRFGMRDDAQVFATEDEAMSTLSDGVECVDNERIAYLDDLDSLDLYIKRLDAGCCGFHDVDVVIAGRKGYAGLNYGH